jgi:hypothetical protein
MRNLALTLVLLAACGGDSITFDSYPDELRDSFCHYLAKCGDVESVDTCRKINIGLNIHLTASQQAAVDMGKVKFNGGSASSCLDALGNRSCDLTSKGSRDAPDACRNITSGTLHADATCAFDAECISQFCNVPRCDTACCMGTCVGDTAPVLAKRGQSCELAPCESGSFCDDATLECTALKAAGANCANAEECDYGLDCSQGGMCTPLPGLGDPCTVICRDVGTTCSPMSHTCVKVALAGEACTNSLDCALVYRCDATKHCVRGPALGEACNVSQLCGDNGAFCDTQLGANTGVCAMPKADGATCNRDAGCESRFCDPNTLKCAAEAVCI